jgi:hypothetical protein
VERSTGDWTEEKKEGQKERKKKKDANLLDKDHHADVVHEL